MKRLTHYLLIFIALAFFAGTTACDDSNDVTDKTEVTSPQDLEKVKIVGSEKTQYHGKEIEVFHYLDKDGNVKIAAFDKSGKSVDPNTIGYSDEDREKNVLEDELKRELNEAKTDAQREEKIDALVLLLCDVQDIKSPDRSPSEGGGGTEKGNVHEQAPSANQQGPSKSDEEMMKEKEKAEEERLKASNEVKKTILLPKLKADRSIEISTEAEDDFMKSRKCAIVIPMKKKDVIPFYRRHKEIIRKITVKKTATTHGREQEAPARGSNHT